MHVFLIADRKEKNGCELPGTCKDYVSAILRKWCYSWFDIRPHIY